MMKTGHGEKIGEKRREKPYMDQRLVRAEVAKYVKEREGITGKIRKNFLSLFVGVTYAKKQFTHTKYPEPSGFLNKKNRELANFEGDKIKKIYAKWGKYLGAYKEVLKGIAVEGETKVFNTADHRRMFKDSIFAKGALGKAYVDEMRACSKELEGIHRRINKFVNHMRKTAKAYDSAYALELRNYRAETSSSRDVTTPRRPNNNVDVNPRVLRSATPRR